MKADLSVKLFAAMSKSSPKKKDSPPIILFWQYVLNTKGYVNFSLQYVIVS